MEHQETNPQPVRCLVCDGIKQRVKARPEESILVIPQVFKQPIEAKTESGNSERSVSVPASLATIEQIAYEIDDNRSTGNVPTFHLCCQSWTRKGATKYRETHTSSIQPRQITKLKVIERDLARFKADLAKIGATRTTFPININCPLAPPPPKRKKTVKTKTLIGEKNKEKVKLEEEYRDLKGYSFLDEDDKLGKLKLLRMQRQLLSR